MKIKIPDRETRIKNKVRNSIKPGTAERPRLSVYRSNKHIYAQLIDDGKNETLVEGSDLTAKKAKKSDKASHVGEVVGKKALEKGIKKAVFDRGPYKYHGRIKLLAEAARKAGLEF